MYSYIPVLQRNDAAPSFSVQDNTELTTSISSVQNDTATSASNFLAYGVKSKQCGSMLI